MLKRFLPCLLSLFGFIPAASAQQSLLWKVSGKGMQQPSYIFGTMHMMCKSDYFMPPAVKTAVQKADTVYLELDMDDPFMLIRVGQLSQLPEGKTLDKIFPPKDYAELNRFFKDSLNMDLSVLNGFKPFVVMAMMAKNNFKCKTLLSYEEDFVKMAKAQHKEIKGLETPDQQMAAVDAISEKDGVKMIMRSVRETKETNLEFQEMLKLYKQQNLNGLYKLMEKNKDLDGYDQVLLDKRNSNWVPAIQQIIGKKSVFFAVGALHLAGPKGVLAQLKAAGYTVTPVQ